MRTLGLVFFLILFVPGNAQARTASSYQYPQSRVWTSVVRMLRVDLKSPILEKDKEVGYVLFSYPYMGKDYSGSVEVLPARRPGEPVKVSIEVSGMPTYVERMMLDRLERKLTRDFGAPVAKPVPPKPAENPPKGQEPPKGSPPKAEPAPQAPKP